MVTGKPSFVMPAGTMIASTSRVSVTGSLSDRYTDALRSLGHSVETGSASRCSAASSVCQQRLAHLTRASEGAVRERRHALGVRVSVVCPGAVATSIFRSAIVVNLPRERFFSSVPLRHLTPSVAALAILRGVVRNDRYIIFPLQARLMWWLHRLSPALFEQGPTAVCAIDASVVCQAGAVGGCNTTGANPYACVAAGVADPIGKGLGVVWTDVNDDGWPDIYVANDTDDNYLYVNRGKAGEVEIKVRKGGARQSMGLEAGLARVPLHLNSRMYDVEGFIAGRNSLTAIEPSSRSGMKVVPIGSTQSDRCSWKSLSSSTPSRDVRVESGATDVSVAAVASTIRTRAPARGAV